MNTRLLLSPHPERHREPDSPAPAGRRRPPTPRLSGPTSSGPAVPRVDAVAVLPPGASAADLLDAATGAQAQPLPYAAELADRFGTDLSWVTVHTGPVVTEALDRLNAQAATRDRDIFLRDRSAPVQVVAHEVAHALQARAGVRGAPSERTAEVVGAATAEEAEAGRLAGSGTHLRAPVRPAEGLAPGAIALLRRGADPGAGAPGPADDRPAPSITVAPRDRVSPEPLPTPAVPQPAPEPVIASPAEAGVRSAAAEPDTAAAFAVPAVPELSASPEQVAAQAAAAAAAEAALAAAGSAAEVLHAFADAPPTVKAQQSAALNSRVDTVLPAETEEWQAAVPTIDADLSGSDTEPPTAIRVEAPTGTATELESGTPGPAPVPDLPDTAAPHPYTANDEVGLGFARLTDPAPEQLADAIGDSLSDVRTSDPSVPRTPGPPPPIPLGGETDPARIEDQHRAGRDQAAEARRAATQLVVDGPGPEQVRPVTVQESHALEAVVPPAAPALEVPEGPQQYLALGLPAEVQAAFDEQQHQAMSESLSEATAQTDAAVSARDTARDEAVTAAQEGATKLNETARADQQAAVSQARGSIQADRQAAVDAQHAAVADVEKQSADRRAKDEGAITDRVAVEQQAIDDSYADGERKITDQVGAAERDAEAERVRAEKEAAEQSWWDRAVNFVKNAFNALVSAIGAIFDKVRAAVNAALDACKQFALSVIDRVANFVKDAISAFGEFLKAAITGLIGDIFPELAAKLNAAIDRAVAAAHSAVDAVADKLKAGISALVEGLRAGLNKALDVYQAAITLAVSVVGAALTGDWGALARRVLEAVLKLIGVDPESFYAFVGRAQETFDIIVNDPLGFLSHLVDALVGGVQGFADRFGDHLRKGVIDWLTGTLGGAGITLPAAFDLMGVLDIARQVLGLTWDRIRAKAVKLVGEQNVARLEYIGSYVTTLVTEGWGGLWTQITADLSGLVDTVFDGIKSFLLERVVLAMIKKIPALFGPVGAIVQLVMTAWNLYEFLRDQLSRIVALVTSVVDSIGDIARGVLTVAVAKVEEVLGNLVPIALDLLAKLLGLGSLSADVRKVIEQVQAYVDKAIDALITRVLALFTGNGSGFTGKGSATAAPLVAGATSDEAGPAVEASPDGLADFGVHEEFKDILGQDHEVENAPDGFELTMSSAVKHLLSEHEDQQVRTRYAAYLQAIAAATSPAGKKKAANKHVTPIVQRIKQWAKTNGGAPRASAPGLGEIAQHSLQRSRLQRSGIRIWWLESEHVIPRGYVDALFSAAGEKGVPASGPEYRKMRTLLIYERAADRKTGGKIGDASAISTFSTMCREMIAEVKSAQNPGAHLVHAVNMIRMHFNALTTDAINRTWEAVKSENRDNGALRGPEDHPEPPSPDESRIKDAAGQQWEDITAMWDQRMAEGEAELIKQGIS